MLRTKQSSAAVLTGATETRPLCLHVYRIGGIWGDDKIVRADDRTTPRYYSKGTRHAASWRLALHAGGPNGDLVCHVRSPYLGPPMMEVDPGPIIITITIDDGSERTVKVHRKKGSLDTFKGLDDKEYRWQTSPRLWGSNLECLDSQDQVVATYRITLFAISKDGELCIHQSVHSMTDLLVATCLAVRTPDH